MIALSQIYTIRFYLNQLLFKIMLRCTCLSEEFNCVHDQTSLNFDLSVVLSWCQKILLIDLVTSSLANLTRPNIAVFYLDTKMLIDGNISF